MKCGDYHGVVTRPARVKIMNAIKSGSNLPVTRYTNASFGLAQFLAIFL